MSAASDAPFECSALKPTDDVPQGVGPSAGSQGRSQSVSATLGELFRLKGARSKSKDDGEDGAEGPGRESQR